MTMAAILKKIYSDRRFSGTLPPEVIGVSSQYTVMNKTDQVNQNTSVWYLVFPDSHSLSHKLIPGPQMRTRNEICFQNKILKTLES